MNTDLKAQEISPVSDERKKELIRSLLPLPKEITVIGEVLPKERTVTGGEQASFSIDVNVVNPSKRLELLKKELLKKVKDFFPNEQVDSSNSKLGLSIQLYVKSDTYVRDLPGIPDLREIPDLKNDPVRNSEQAYAIVPIGSNPGQFVKYALVGNEDVGVHYAVQTLMQLIEAAAPDSIPIVLVRDWPDLAERGLWWGFPSKPPYSGKTKDCIASMVSRKFNFLQVHAFPEDFDKGKNMVYTPLNPKINSNNPKINSKTPEIVKLVREAGIGLIPIMGHLDQLPAHIDIKDQESVCYESSSTFHKFMAAWMSAVAKVQGVYQVSGWLAENVNSIECGCDYCQEGLNKNRFVEEVKAFLEARKKFLEAQSELELQKELGLRIVLSQASYKDDNRFVFDALEDKKHICVDYYHGGKTYKASKKPMVYELLREFACKGRSIGIYPQLLATHAYNTPFPCVHFIRERMKEFVNAGLKTLVGRLHQAEWPYYPMNLDAAAEYSWNAYGRDSREFAAAWASRAGFANPDKVAEWSELIGPVAWNVHAGRFPIRFDNIVKSICAGNALKLGEDPLEGFASDHELEKNISDCDDAVKEIDEARAKDIAEDIAEAEKKVVTILEATNTIKSYLRLLQSMLLLSKATAAKNESKKLGIENESEELEIIRREILQSENIQKHMYQYANSCRELVESLDKWFKAVERECPEEFKYIEDNPGLGFREYQTKEVFYYNCRQLADYFIDQLGDQPTRLSESEGQTPKDCFDEVFGSSWPKLIGGWKKSNFSSDGSFKFCCEVTEKRIENGIDEIITDKNGAPEIIDGAEKYVVLFIYRKGPGITIKSVTFCLELKKNKPSEVAVVSTEGMKPHYEFNLTSGTLEKCKEKDNQKAIYYITVEGSYKNEKESWAANEETRERTLTDNDDKKEKLYGTVYFFKKPA